MPIKLNHTPFQQYLQLARQWNGHPIDSNEIVCVEEGLEILRIILDNSSLPLSLRQKARELQLDIILNNKGPNETEAKERMRLWLV